MSFYDPTTGTFLTRDPINAITRAAYGYVYGNPLNNTDPSGLYCLTGVKAISYGGHEICNGNDQIDDNLVPDFVNDAWNHEWSFDWGTAGAGLLNVAAGGLKIRNGVQGWGLSPVCMGLVWACRGISAYMVVSGGFKVARGGRQLNTVREDPDGPEGQCTTGDNLARLARGVVPFGEGDWLSVLGGLP